MSNRVSISHAANDRIEAAITLGLQSTTQVTELPTSLAAAHARIRELDIRFQIERAAHIAALRRAELAERQLASQLTFEAKPTFIDGRVVQLATRSEMAAFFGVTEGTIDDWHDRGVIPAPIAPPQRFATERKSTAGRRYLRWDFHEAVEQIMGYRQVA